MNPIFKFLTSLRLTVWLLGIAVVLVFLGSIAQVPEGLWNAQARWFKTLLVIRREGDEWWVPPIFPGGHLVGGLLFINLLAAHIKRFRWDFQKFGIHLTHFGVIVLLVGQLATDKLAVESVMQFTEKEQRNFTENHRDVELIFAHDAANGQEEVVSFPQALVREKGELRHEKLPFSVRVRDYQINGALLSLRDMPNAAANVKRALTALDGKFTTVEALPAIAEADLATPARRVVWRKALRAMGEDDEDIVAAVKKIAAAPAKGRELMAKVSDQFPREMIEVFSQAGRDELQFGQPELGSETGYAAELALQKKDEEATRLPAAATTGVGTTVHAIPRPEIKDDQKGRNYPWAVLEIMEAGKPVGTWLVSTRMNNQQEFTIGGAKWRVALRNERYYLPYAIQLVRAKQEVYQGTNQASQYASRVRIINPAAHEDRETDISMNIPLRYQGLTFYQATMNQRDRGPGTAAWLEALTGKPRSEFAGIEDKEGGRFSGLQTVSNPSIVAPYTGCLLVGFGMLWQFLFHLTGFLSKRTGLPSPSFGVPHPLLPVCAVLIMVPDIFLAWIALKDGSIFALAVVAVTPIIRGVLARQVWLGRHLVFAMVMLLIPTVLAVPFAIRYWASHGQMLGPLVIAQFAAFAGIAYVVFSNRPAPAANAVRA